MARVCDQRTNVFLQLYVLLIGFLQQFFPVFSLSCNQKLQTFRCAWILQFTKRSAQRISYTLIGDKQRLSLSHRRVVYQRFLHISSCIFHIIERNARKNLLNAPQFFAESIQPIFNIVTACRFSFVEVHIQLRRIGISLLLNSSVIIGQKRIILMIFDFGTVIRFDDFQNLIERISDFFYFIIQISYILMFLLHSIVSIPVQRPLHLFDPLVIFIQILVLAGAHHTILLALRDLQCLHASLFYRCVVICAAVRTRNCIRQIDLSAAAAAHSYLPERSWTHQIQRLQHPTS